MVAKYQKDWAYRSAVHDTTGQTSARIVFGRELCLPCDILFGSPSEDPKEVLDYVDDLKEKLPCVHKTVHHKIRVVNDGMKTRYNLKGNSIGFRQGIWYGFIILAVVTRLGRSIYCRDENQRCRLQNSSRAEDENEDGSFRPLHEGQQ